MATRPGGLHCVVKRDGVWKVEYFALADIGYDVVAGFRDKVEAQAHASKLNQEGR